MIIDCRTDELLSWTLATADELVGLNTSPGGGEEDDVVEQGDQDEEAGEDEDEDEDDDDEDDEDEDEEEEEDAPRDAGSAV